MSINAQDENIVESLTGLVATFFSIIQKQAKLFKLEWQLAKESAIVLMFLGLIFFVLLIGTWLSILGVTAFLLFGLLHNWLFVLLATVIINIALIGITLMVIMSYVKNLRFSHTRKQLTHWRTKKYAEDKAIEEAN